jgi:hypothetical protein
MMLWLPRFRWERIKKKEKAFRTALDDSPRKTNRVLELV